jgi:hypothetical protein
MTRRSRLTRIEARILPDPPLMTFRRCEAPEGLSQAEHDEWHRQRGDAPLPHFTLNLGDCDIRRDV